MDSETEGDFVESRSTFGPVTSARTALGGRRVLLLSVLLLLDGFALGGCLTSLMMRNLVIEMMAVYEDSAQVLAVYNLFDHLLPYYLCYGGALLALTVTTVCVWVAVKPTKPL
jgi:hypothetical protein